MLFGLAETSIWLYKKLTKNYKDIGVKVKDVVKTASMIKKQVRA